MITRSVIDSVVQPALLTPITVAPVSGTALSVAITNLLEEGKVKVACCPKEDAHSDLPVETIAGLVANGETEIDKLSDIVAKVVKNNIYLTRQVVLPMIERYTDALNNQVNLSACHFGIALNVTMDTKANLLGHQALADLASKYKDKVYYTVPLPKKFTGVSQEALEEMLVTGIKSFDEEFKSWYALNNMANTAMRVYEDIFCKENSYHATSQLNHLLNAKDWEACLLTILIAIHLEKNIPDGLNMTIQEYELMLNRTIAVASTLLATAIDRFHKDFNNKALVLQYPGKGREFDFTNTETNNIVVNSTVYEEFLDNGGSPEVLFGAYLTDRVTNANRLLEDRVEYVKAYNRVVAQGKLIRSNKLINTVRDGLKTISIDIIKSFATLQGEDEVDAHGQLVLLDNTIGRKADAFINNIKANDVEDLYKLMTKFICSVFFKDSAVGDILRRIELLTTDDNNDIHELALIASIDFVIDWLFTQVKATNVGEALKASNYL